MLWRTAIWYLFLSRGRVPLSEKQQTISITVVFPSVDEQQPFDSAPDNLQLICLFVYYPTQSYEESNSVIFSWFNTRIYFWVNPKFRSARNFFLNMSWFYPEYVCLGCWWNILWRWLGRSFLLKCTSIGSPFRLWDVWRVSSRHPKDRTKVRIRHILDIHRTDLCYVGAMRKGTPEIAVNNTWRLSLSWVIWICEFIRMRLDMT